jgi:hypothetical protein
MSISIPSKKIFQAVSNESATIAHSGFYLTQIPVSLAKFGDQNLISQYQAKRVAGRVEKLRKASLIYMEMSAAKLL